MFYFADDTLLHKCRAFLESLIKVRILYYHFLIVTDEGTDTQIKSDRVFFSGCGYGRGCLDDFGMSFSVPKEVCKDGFSKLRNF